VPPLLKQLKLLAMALGKAPSDTQNGTGLGMEHCVAAFRGADHPQHSLQMDQPSLGSGKAWPIPAFPLFHSLLSLPCPCSLVVPWAVRPPKPA